MWEGGGGGGGGVAGGAGVLLLLLFGVFLAVFKIYFCPSFLFFFSFFFSLLFVFGFFMNFSFLFWCVCMCVRVLLLYSDEILYILFIEYNLSHIHNITVCNRTPSGNHWVHKEGSIGRTTAPCIYIYIMDETQYVLAI